MSLTWCSETKPKTSGLRTSMTNERRDAQASAAWQDLWLYIAVHVRAHRNETVCMPRNTVILITSSCLLELSSLHLFDITIFHFFFLMTLQEIWLVPCLGSPSPAYEPLSSLRIPQSSYLWISTASWRIINFLAAAMGKPCMQLIRVWTPRKQYWSDRSRASVCIVST